MTDETGPHERAESIAERLARLERAVETLTERASLDDGQGRDGRADAFHDGGGAGAARLRERGRAGMARAEASLRGWFEARPTLSILGAVTAAIVLFQILD